MDKYISKQKIIDRMGCCLSNAKAEYKAAKDEFTKARFEDYISAIQAMIDVAECAEVADIQPVKQGHWIEEVREIGETFRLYQTYIHCSECGKEHYSGTLPKPNYCDACGAKMGGDTE